MYLLDTNVVSALRRRDNAERRVVEWFRAVPLDRLFVSAVTVLELEIGVRRMERRDPRQGAMIRRWLDGRVLPSFEGRIKPFDLQAAQVCALLHVPDPRPEKDAMIAATAIIHGLTLVSRNISDFRSMGVAIFDPWAA